MIVRSNPAAALDEADQAWFDSDAPGNREAIQEIDAEAARHGLVRTREYWLQTFSLPDGRVVRRGFCYRPEPSGRQTAVAARRGSKAEGQSAAETVRTLRDEG
jgi:hypothetical protein